MGPVCTDCAEILENNSIGVIGQTIWYDKEPPEGNGVPTDVVTIYAYSSQASNGYTCVEPERYNIQVTCRSKVHLDGYNQINSIKSLLDRQTFTIAVSGADTQYRFVAVSLPINLQQDSKNRHIVVMNFWLMRQTVTT